MSLKKKLSIGVAALFAPIALYATLVYADVVKSPFQTEALTIGKASTPSENVKLRRGASGLQLVPGDDSTADGSDASSFKPLEANTLDIKGTGGNGGNVPHNCYRKTATSVNGTTINNVCPEGEIIGGGGCWCSNGSIGLAANYPSSDMRTWVCATVSSCTTLFAMVICCDY